MSHVIFDNTQAAYTATEVVKKFEVTDVVVYKSKRRLDGEPGEEATFNARMDICQTQNLIFTHQVQKNFGEGMKGGDDRSPLQD